MQTPGHFPDYTASHHIPFPPLLQRLAVEMSGTGLGGAEISPSIPIESKVQMNWSRRQDSNPRPAVYKTAALPLSYVGKCTYDYGGSGAEVTNKTQTQELELIQRPRNPG